MGDVVKVKDGYARNLLLPSKWVSLATSANIKMIEKQKLKKAREEEKAKSQAEALAEKLGKMSCTVTVEVNDLDKLYGSVSEADIRRALETEGFSLDDKQIIIDQPIEELGIFEVGVKLHPEVTAKFRLWVAKK
jgi:large subunit ribosomal protein L9